MLTAAELKAVLDMASAQVTVLGRQLEEAADREAKEVADAKVGRQLEEAADREAKEVADAKVGS